MDVPRSGPEPPYAGSYGSWYQPAAKAASTAAMLYPLTFHPIFKERIWGGRELERLYAKPLPPGQRIGESWEITDRAEGISVISHGRLAGKDLRWVMDHHGTELLGSAKALNGRFPLLVKILDAREQLSLQVHPPPQVAAQLKGEPKTEFWYVAEAAGDAQLFAGLKRGVTRATFERKVKDGSVAAYVHRLAVRRGDVMFLPSGRVHAIGAGIVIFEIQQNSDTTYRVFDWNRPGLDGKPRALHVAESLASVDFTDIEPSLIRAETLADDGVRIKSLVRHPVFNIDLVEMASGSRLELGRPACAIVALIRGALKVVSPKGEIDLAGGDCCLIPAASAEVVLIAQSPVSFLQSEPG
jgi:mannose-6-phosphate isomerase